MWMIRLARGAVDGGVWGGFLRRARGVRLGEWGGREGVSVGGERGGGRWVR